MEKEKGVLILTRHKGESFVLVLPGDRQVTVKVTDIRSRGRDVVLGIEAPLDVRVNREETQLQLERMIDEAKERTMEARTAIESINLNPKQLGILANIRAGRSADHGFPDAEWYGTNGLVQDLQTLWEMELIDSSWTHRGWVLTTRGLVVLMNAAKSV